MVQPTSRPATPADLPAPGEVITFNGYVRKRDKYTLVIAGKQMPKGINNISAKAIIPIPSTEAIVYLGESMELYGVEVSGLAWKLIKQNDGKIPDEYEVSGIIEEYYTIDEYPFWR